MFTVVVGTAAEGVPEDTRSSLSASLQEIAAAVATMPLGSMFWNSVRGLKLHLDLAGWRFWYVVEPEERRVSLVRSLPIDG
ncbi:MAG TPA: hypothetical protein VFE90_05610 [Myxococcales bacterium]|jgi:hypothetical protein|nr:hypothetical protein [Myxococcales bacterium]